MMKYTVLFNFYRKLFGSYNLKNALRECDHRTEEDCIG